LLRFAATPRKFKARDRRSIAGVIADAELEQTISQPLKLMIRLATVTLLLAATGCAANVPGKHAPFRDLCLR